ncbi:8362_t:CDS:2 [Ambispora gerdemannii]|uniref:8362_t:CDS:1 n=1 Tax=Ambispora gerdemannii TaxID=144530 RepID=A0A9N9C5F0_9GLOM|nr:8362_t:CDS:2 [Ambispora gerdemannii]
MAEIENRFVPQAGTLRSALLKEVAHEILIHGGKLKYCLLDPAAMTYSQSHSIKISSLTSLRKKLGDMKFLSQQLYSRYKKQQKLTNMCCYTPTLVLSDNGIRDVKIFVILLFVVLANKDKVLFNNQN